MATAIKSSKKIQGMGAIPHERGVAFRVWAPNADAVYVCGTFNDWSEMEHALTPEENGYWYRDIPQADTGQEYRYLIHNGQQRLWRIDPYAREVTNSVGNSIIHDPYFDWEGDDFRLPDHRELAIYELHIGSFAAASKEELPSCLIDLTEKLDYLGELGINAIEVMPAAEFAGDFSWGYNPAHIFAIESAYGGPQAFKEFVKAAHRKGLAVILDVVYNHFGPSDLHLWKFDGWSENDLGGIYFYNDWRAQTPWGNSRPDYGRSEVRQYIRDNAMMWLEEYHVDGLRMDMTPYIRSVRGEPGPGDDLPDGWALLQWINGEIRERFPHCIAIAEDLHNNEWITKPIDDGGAGFHAQWDAKFVHPIRSTVEIGGDADRSVTAVRDAIAHRFNNQPWQRVVYSESHDEVANGKSRTPSSISSDAENLYAQKRSLQAAAFVLTAPGMPMLFQGQEFLQPGWFRDDEPLDWSLTEKFSGILQMYKDLLRLRLNRQGNTRGLCGDHLDFLAVDEGNNLLAYHRWDQGGPGDDVVVVANLSNQMLQAYRIRFPATGAWRLRLNSDWKGYSEQFGGHFEADAQANASADGVPHADVGIAPYSIHIYSQDPQG